MVTTSHLASCIVDNAKLVLRLGLPSGHVEHVEQIRTTQRKGLNKYPSYPIYPWVIIIFPHWNMRIWGSIWGQFPILQAPKMGTADICQIVDPSDTNRQLQCTTERSIQALQVQRPPPVGQVQFGSQKGTPRSLGKSMEDPWIFQVKDWNEGSSARWLLILWRQPIKRMDSMAPRLWGSGPSCDMANSNLMADIGPSKWPKKGYIPMRFPMEMLAMFIGTWYMVHIGSSCFPEFFSGTPCHFVQQLQVNTNFMIFPLDVISPTDPALKRNVFFFAASAHGQAILHSTGSKSRRPHSIIKPSASEPDLGCIGWLGKKPQKPSSVGERFVPQFTGYYAIPMVKKWEYNMV